MIFIFSNSSDAHQQSRLSKLSEYNKSIITYKIFRNDYYKGVELDDFASRIIGQLSHGKFSKRMSVFAKLLLSLIKDKKESSLIYVYGLDNLLVCVLFKYLINKSTFILYEVDDLHDSYFKKNVLGFTLDMLHKLLLPQIDLLVVTSKSFVIDYFYKKNYKIKSFLEIQNKVIISNNSISNLQDKNISKRISGNHKITLGYLGLIRCKRTVEFLKYILDNSNRFNVRIYGYVIDAEVKSILKENSNLMFLGEYKSPIDLPKIYSEIDLCFANYPYSEKIDGNWRYARTNRFYESLFFNTPVIVQDKTKDSYYVEKYNIGISIDLKNLENCFKKIENINVEKIKNYKASIDLLPSNFYTITNEFNNLFSIIKEKKELELKNDKVCSNCVMDTTDKMINFDDKGFCDHCITYYNDIEPSWKKLHQNKRSLELLIDKIKKQGKGKDFDCILGVSGGVDSTYLLYKITSEYGLKPLVFHVDAGWNTQIAVNNIEMVVDRLNLDLFTEVIDWEEMKDLQLAFFKSGVPHIDVPQDHAFFAAIYKYAAKYNIKTILTGANYSTECVRNPVEWMYYQSDARQLLDIHKKYGSKQLKKFPVTNIIWHKIYLPYIRNIKVQKLLNYLKYDKEEATNVLIEKIDYQKYNQKHFESRFTRFYESYWLPRRFGYDVRKVQYSSLILTGQMTREEALEKLKQPSFDDETAKKEFEFVANKLDITTDELQKYFELPKKTYKDYKSQESMYKIGAAFMKKLGLERGGKR